MKKLDTEKLKSAYPEPPESFHNAVTGALNALDDKKPLKFTKRRTAIRIAAACAAVAVIGTFAVAAAATDFFGLIATKKGTYGLNVTVESGTASENEYKRMNLTFGYLPESYVNSSNYPSWFDYSNGDEYFNACVEHTNSFDEDYLNVIDTVETEYDGHKTLFITFKEAENTDKLYYVSLKYFDEYKRLIRCSCTDFEELKKITAKIGLEPAPDDQPAPDVVEDANDYYYDGAILDYDRDDYGFRDAFLSNKIKEAKIGESIELKAADYDEEPATVKAKVKSIIEQDNADGLEKNGFIVLGKAETTFDHYFNADGSLIKENTYTKYEGNDEDHLGTAVEITDKEHFYVAEIELTSDKDIDDLNKSFLTNVFMFKDRCYYGYSNENSEYALKIYYSKENEKFSLKKGEPVTVKIGFITENDVVDMTYISLSAVDASESDYQNYMIKVAE